jgi:hypothetical protein
VSLSGLPHCLPAELALTFVENGDKLKAKFWYIGIPVIIIAFVNSYLRDMEESAHLASEPIHQVAYPYLGVIKKVSPNALFPCQLIACSTCFI